jgi:hypothetical protein
MSNELMRRVGDAMLTQDQPPLPARLTREVQRAVDRQAGLAVVRATAAQADAYEANTRVELAAFVTETGLSLAARLSRHEEELIQGAPLGEARYKHLVDSFAMLAADEVRKLGQP